jgi:RimJ/RimL family protein N-acetyltransferase
MSALQQPGFPQAAREITVRTLNESDAEALRDIRLHCLKTVGEFMGPTYESESKRTLDEWKAVARETTDKAVFGLFNGTQLIGIMRAMKYDEDPSGQTALWGMTYLMPEYRSAGIAAPLYKAREEWTKQRYNRAMFFIREDNQRSQEIHLKHGAEYICTRQMNWPDRPNVGWRWFEVNFKR